MWKSVPIVSVACATTLLRAEPEVKGTPVELTAYLTGIPRLVSVTGEAEVRIPAKRALLTLTVITEYRSLQEALRANADLRAKVTSHLKQQGIPADRVQSSKFSSTPKFGIFGEKAKSYRVENLMRVSVQDEKELRSAASAVDAFAEVQYAGVEFEYADRESLKLKAIAHACDNAEERKKVYAEHLGFKLAATRFSEGTVAEQESRPAGRDYAKGRVSSFEYSSSVGESTSSFGELVYNAKVTVEFVVQSK